MLRFISIMLLASFVFASTAEAQSSRKRISDRLTNLETQLLSIQEAMKNAGKADDLKQIRVMYADLNAKLSGIERQMAALTGQLEEMQFKQREQDDKLALLQKDMELRFSELQMGAAPISSAPTEQQRPSAIPNMAGQDSGATLPAQASAPQLEAVEAEAVTLPAGNDKEQFDYAFSFVRKGDFATGEKALKAFMEEQAASPLMANAKFWLGRIYLMRKETARAAGQFLNVITEHPDSDKVGASLLELADALIKMDEKVEACRTLADYARVDQNPTERTLSRVKRLAGLAACQ